VHAGRLLIGVQRTLLIFYWKFVVNPVVPRGVSGTALGSHLREDMLWLNDVYEDAIDVAPEIGKQDLGNYSRVGRLLSCSQERANSIHFWQCFVGPDAMVKYGTISKRTCQDMLSQYVPEHRDGRTPLQLSAVSLAYALAREDPGRVRNMEMMIVCILESGADLHEAVESYTPLALFLETITRNRGWIDDGLKVADYLRPRDLRRMLKVWLKILQRAGVDLIAYGAEESRTLQAVFFIENRVTPTLLWDDDWIGDYEVHYFTFSWPDAR
jgi:hypothetical protein